MEPHVEVRKAAPPVLKTRPRLGARPAIAAVGCLLTISTLSVQATEPDSPIERTIAVASGVSSDGFHVLDEQMRELIDVLLAENPDVVAAWTRSSASFERVPQERSLPDPTLVYRYFARTPETRVGPQEHALELSQAVPWGGKRRLQAARAESSAASVTWNAEDLERRAVADLKRAYFEAAYLQEALSVNQEERELLERFERIALTRYSTGQGIQQSVVKVQTQISRLDDRETELRQRLDVLQRRMAELIGSPDRSLTLAAIRPPFPVLHYDRAELERLAVSEHPRVRAMLQTLDGDRAWAQRRKLEFRPDFRLGVGWTTVGRREDTAGISAPPEGNGKDILALSFGLNLPVHRSRIRAGVNEAQQSERAHRETLTAVQNELRFDLQQAVFRLDSLEERGRLYDEVIIPQAEESLASAEAAYTTNKLSFLDLLDAERVLFESRLTYHRLVADLWIALTDVELATARPFPPA